MRKPKLWKLQRLNELDLLVAIGKQRSFQILIALALLYLFLITLQMPSLSPEPPPLLLLHLQAAETPIRPRHWGLSPSSSASAQTRPMNSRVLVSRLSFDPKTFDPSAKDRSVELHRAAKIAWEEGMRLWVELESGRGVRISPGDAEAEKAGNGDYRCPSSLYVSGSQFLKRRKLMLLRCGLTLGSHVTVVAKPTADDQKGSQFIMELQGLRTVEGEEPPRILHFNPRLKGDWSGKPVIEHNTCYRMQWGTSQRCDGWPSKANDETVDGLAKCQKWIRDGGDNSASSKARWWLNRLIGRTKNINVDWPFPFSEGKLFVLTLSAGLEGYHINVDGRHVTSFPYRTGFTLDDATGLTLSGDVDIHSIFAASLPTSHPSFSPQRHLEMSSQWKAPRLPDQPVELFIGILSAGYHFAERMAVRKSWMQHVLVKSSAVVARFFVGLNARKEVNMELKQEAEFFGDIVIVPYMDSYDLVVLKTAAICEYGARTLSARYIMKCDDDTFVRLDAVINEVDKVSEGKSFYIGNINYFHKPLRHGKWAVTYEEWPEEDYPPYANGPGYLFSSDIALFIVSEFESHQLRLFKMEDVSMGMWVARFNSSKPVEYGHSLKFCQFGCIDGYYTAHYQSPRQMICLWEKLQKDRRAHCCNMR